MAAIPMVTQKGQRTYTAAEAILGGQLVEGRTGSDKGRVGVAGAASNKVLGVAVTDGINPEAIVTGSTVVAGHPTLNAAPIPTAVTVVSGGIEVPVTYAANASLGDKLIAAANGAVTPAGATPDARQIVGKCTQPGGVVIATTPIGLMQTA